MTSILCIDTALETAHVGLAEDGQLLNVRSNAFQSDHAAWIHKAIKEILVENGKKFADIQAIAVTSGPGSYTGLRVGMATAKGLCYAIGKPLIAENTLKLTAMAARAHISMQNKENFVFRPMIDARRMEVFTALYGADLQELDSPRAVILDELAFSEELDRWTVVFSGNGAEKWSKMCSNSRAFFPKSAYELAHLAQIAQEKYQLQQFSDLAYLEPDYFKSFYTGN